MVHLSADGLQLRSVVSDSVGEEKSTKPLFNRRHKMLAFNLSNRFLDLGAARARSPMSESGMSLPGFHTVDKRRMCVQLVSRMHLQLGETERADQFQTHALADHDAAQHPAE